MPIADKTTTTPVAIDLDEAPVGTGTENRVEQSAAPLLAARLVRWLEDGVRPDDLFADDLFSDLSLPQWRIQGTSAEEGFRLRESSHPFAGQVRVERLVPTDSGFLLQFEERWAAGGQQWYCREMLHAQVDGARVTRMDIYCTGDWDEAVQRRHATEVRLARP